MPCVNCPGYEIYADESCPATAYHHATACDAVAVTPKAGVGTPAARRRPR